MARTTFTRPFATGLAVLMLVAGLGTVVVPSAMAMPSGQLGAWGAGAFGQLGDGNITNSTSAVSVLSSGVLAGKAIVQVDAGDGFACAVTADGLLACWGSNQYGQLGIGPSGNQSSPHAVSGGVLAGKQVVQVSAGYKHACALTKDGLLACWGDGSSGTLGNQPSASSPVPAAVYTGGVLTGRTITQVSAGSLSTCVVASGAVSCWGFNNYGQLGDGTVATRLIPVNALSTSGSALTGKTVTEVSTGQSHTCARSSDGTIACWGSNGQRQAIPSTATSLSVPASVNQGALRGRSATHVSAGVDFTCAVASGAVVCWGSNRTGQMANGARSNTPQAVPALATTAAPSALAGKTVASISAGWSHVCAVTTDGAIACWGYGANGELGTNAPDNALSIPFAVTGTPGSGVMKGAIARAVAAGFGFSIGLTSSLPDSPSDLTAKAGDTQVTVSWVPPKATGGSPITTFVVQQSTDAGATWAPAVGSPSSGNATSFVATKLPNGVGVTFRVAAVTAVGQGAFSTPTSLVKPEAAAVTPTPTPTPTATPTAPAVVRPGVVQGLLGRSPKSRAVALSWQPPATGTAPTSYQVRRKQGAHRYSPWTTVTTTSVNLRKLKTGKRYSFAVRAGNAAGFGPGTVVKVTVH